MLGLGPGDAISSINFNHLTIHYMVFNPGSCQWGLHIFYPSMKYYMIMLQEVLISRSHFCNRSSV